MTNLALSYVTLFVAATLIGFAAGWLLRRVVTTEQRNDLEDDIAQLAEAVRQSRGRAGLEP